MKHWRINIFSKFCKFRIPEISNPYPHEHDKIERYVCNFWFNYNVECKIENCPLKLNKFDLLNLREAIKSACRYQCLGIVDDMKQCNGCQRYRIFKEIKGEIERLFSVENVKNR